MKLRSCLNDEKDKGSKTKTVLSRSEAGCTV